MSRCLPFPPPVYEKNNHIELGSVKHEARTEKRENKKRDKKHKGSEKSGGVHVGSMVKEMSNVETENLNGSDLTAEHEQAVVSGIHCYLSDDTCSGTTKRNIEAPGHDRIGRQGRVIRIKLPLQKLNERNVTTFKPCSASCSLEHWNWKDEVNQSSHNGHGVESGAKTLNSISNAAQENQSAKSELESTEGRTKSSKLSSEVLMDNWNLLPFQASLPLDKEHEDWLFNLDIKPKRSKVCQLHSLGSHTLLARAWSLRTTVHCNFLDYQTLRLASIAEVASALTILSASTSRNGVVPIGYFCLNC